MSASLPPQKLSFSTNVGTINFLASPINLIDHVGFEGPEPQHRLVEQPLRDGSLFIATRYHELFPIILFDLEADTYQQLMQRRRQIIPTLAPRNAIGTLHYQSGTGAEEFLIDAKVQRRAQSGSGNLRVMIESWTVQFLAPFPFWRDAVATETPIASGTPEVVSNDGDIESFPTFEVTPSATVTNPTITNSTTGKSLAMTAQSIAAGQTLIVDMFNQTITKDGVNAIGSITTESEFWSLATGNNTISITHASGTATWTMRHNRFFEGV